MRIRSRSSPHDSVRCEKAQNLSGRVETHPATFAPAGSSQSRRSGNEAAEAFEEKVSSGRSASEQAVTRVNTEQASKRAMRTPTCLNHREG